MKGKSVGKSDGIKGSCKVAFQPFCKTIIKPTIFLSLLLFLFPLLPAWAAELLPFSSGQPQAQRVIPPVNQNQFRDQISGLSCSDLRYLEQQIGDKYRSSTTTQQRDYYAGYYVEITNMIHVKNCDR